MHIDPEVLFCVIDGLPCFSFIKCDTHKWWLMKSAEAWFISTIFKSSLRTSFSCRELDPDAFWRVHEQFLTPGPCHLWASRPHLHDEAETERQTKHHNVHALDARIQQRFTCFILEHIYKYTLSWSYCLCLLLSIILHLFTAVSTFAFQIISLMCSHHYFPLM